MNLRLIRIEIGMVPVGLFCLSQVTLIEAGLIQFEARLLYSKLA